MRKIIPFRHPLRPEAFEDMVKERSSFSHMVFLTDHIKQQMVERRITTRQILNVLRKGSLANLPKRNEATASYEGKMKYHGTGREITVVCAIRQSELTVIAITVY